MKTAFANEEIPYFSWDRALTVGQIKEMLQTQTGRSWSQLAAFADVWQFLTPREVWQRFGDLEPFLGRWRDFWRFILKAWHELGRI